MDFEEWWNENKHCFASLKDDMKDAYEAGIQEGIDRMYRLYDICPECKLPKGQHKMDCTRG